MQRKIVKFLLFMLISVSVNTAFAEETTCINGINYILHSRTKEATVMAKEGGYSGSVKIPETLTIDYEPYKVTGIGSGAFSDCSQLKEVIIPKTINGIFENAFTNVPAGLNIYINKSSVIGFVKKGFDQSCFDNATIYLPTESILKDYKNRPVWCNFTKTGIVPKDKSDGVDRRKGIEKATDNKRMKTSSKSKKIKY